MTPYTQNFQNSTCVLTFLVKIDFYFLGLSSEIFFGVITDNSLHLYPLKKCKKECDIVEVILVQGFCPLKIEITQFPDGFRLKCLRLSLCVSHNL